MVGRDPASISPQLETETRKVLRCTFCALNQFETKSGKCRRCHRPYFTPEPVITKVRHAGREFGYLIRILREARGLKQADMARRLNRPRSWMHKIEYGLHEPTTETIFRMARALDLPAAALAHCYEVARH